jgi:hypothetical protein
MPWINPGTQGVFQHEEQKRPWRDKGGQRRHGLKVSERPSSRAGAKGYDARPPRSREGQGHERDQARSSNIALAVCRSAVSKPSVNRR